MSDVKIGRMMIGSYQTNCYFLFKEETKKAVVIDPADNGKLIYDKLTQSISKIVIFFNFCNHF